MYKELSKEEKKALVEKFIKNKRGKNLYDTLNRLFFEGSFCLLSFVVILIAIFVTDLEWWYWFFVGLTLFCGVLFLVGQHIIRMKEYNRFYNQLNKNEKKLLTKNK